MSTKYIPATEVAKLIRKDLKAAFPGISFKVTTKSASTVNVFWTDGPSDTQVNKVIGKYSGAKYDFVLDLQVYTKDNWGCDNVNLHRSHTVEFVRKVATSYCQRFGYNVPRIIEGTYPQVDPKDDFQIEYTRDWLSCVIARRAYETDARIIAQEAPKADVVADARAKNFHRLLTASKSRQA